MITRLFLPNLRTRLVAVIFLALLPAFVLLITIAALERTRAEESARLETMAMAQLLKSQYGEVITTTRETLEWLATDPAVMGQDRQACNTRLIQFDETIEQFSELKISNPDRTVRCAASRQTQAGTLTGPDHRSFQRAVTTRDFAIGDVQVAEGSGKTQLTISYPILDEDGEVTAVIGALMNVEFLTRHLTNTPFYQYASLLLIDRNGTVILRHPDAAQFVGRNVVDTLLFQSAQKLREGWIDATGLHGQPGIFAVTPVDNQDPPELYALAGLNEEYVFAGVNRMLRMSLLGLTVIGLAALVAAWVSAELMIVRRTQQVVDAALRMRAGDFSARVGMPDDNSEMGQLAQTFDSMAVALQERDSENERLIAQMQQLNAELESRVIKRTEQLQTSNLKLLQSQADLRRLSEELMRVTEQERTRISREIHDQLGQLLTAIKMGLRTIERASARDPQHIGDRVTETISLVDETIKTVRRIAADLRPGILDDFGLEAAVEWQLQQFRDRTGLAVQLESEIDEARLSKDMATAAFRILQEALTNVARHAEATQVQVALLTLDNTFMLTVQDNGKGLDVEPQRKSFGVVGMRERARQFGGSIDISGPSGAGVTVRLKLPLSQVGVADRPAAAD